MKQKNTQNATTPTKGTRQYKHTPTERKRLRSRIYALLACLQLSVLLVVPSFATSYTTNTSGTTTTLSYATPLVPKCIQYEQHASNSTNLGVTTLDIPYTTTSDATNSGGLLTNSSPNLVNNYAIDGTSTITITPRANTVQSSGLGYVSFIYTNATYNPANRAYVPRIILEYSHQTSMRYVIYGEYTDTNRATHEFSLTRERYVDNENEPQTTTPHVDNLDYVYGYLDLEGTITFNNLVVTAIPITDTRENNVDAIFTSVSITHTPITPNSEAERLYNANIAPSTITETIYQQVINEGTFSSLFRYLGETISGVMGVTLFEIAGITVTPAHLLGAVLSFLLIFAFLRFFAGG